MQEVNSLVSLVCIPVSIHHVPLRALIDSGASENFISSDVVSSLSLQAHDLKCPSSLRIADGSVHNVTKFVLVRITFGSLIIPLVLRIFQMSHQIILGFPFLQRFQPYIDWADKCLSFVYRGRSVTLCSADKTHVRPLYGRRVTLSCLETTQPSLFVKTSSLLREGESKSQQSKVPCHSNVVLDNLGSFQTAVESQPQENPENPQELTPFALDDFVLGKTSNKEKQEPKQTLNLVNVPKEGITLISSFSELFPLELPSGLPPKREIEFRIELVPQAIPHKHRVY